MNGHLAISTLLLLAVSYIDLRERRIPNGFLLTAIFFHLLFDLAAGSDARIDYLRMSVIMALVLLPLIILDRLRRLVMRSIGMGDIKLFLYLSFFHFPWIRSDHFLLGFLLLSLLVLSLLYVRHLLSSKLRASPWRSSIPLAPLFLGGSITALML